MLVLGFVNHAVCLNNKLHAAEGVLVVEPAAACRLPIDRMFFILLIAASNPRCARALLVVK